MIKKIIIISPAYPLRGGIAASGERLAKELQTQGKQVIIYSYSLQYPSILFPGTSQYSTSPPPIDLDIRTRINSIQPFNWISVGKEIALEKPDVVICRYWLPFMAPALGTILRYVKKNKHTKIIALADNIIPHEKRLGDKQLSDYFIKSVDGFLVMSKSVEEQLQHFRVKKPIVYSPHPIYDIYGESVQRNAALEKLQLSQTQRYLLFFGFIRKYKGLDLLLAAMCDERIKKLPIKLLVAGEFYDAPAQYLAFVNENNLTDKVIFYNEFIPDDEVKYYFSASDIVVQPYRTATQSGISQIAYHFEKPMIVTNVGGLPEIVPNGEVGYVVVGTPNEIANAIVAFFENDEQNKFADGLRKQKQNYSWANMCEQIEVLSSII